MNNKRFLIFFLGVLLAALSGLSISAQEGPHSSMTLAEALATGECDEGDTPCLEALMRSDDKSSDDKSSDDKSSDDKSSDDKSSDDKSSDDKSSDDKSSDDKSSDDKSSDDKSSDDKSSDDKSSDDKSSDDKSSDDKSSDDKSSDDQSSDDDSSSDDGAAPNVSIGDGQGTEFNNVTNVPVVLTINLDAAAATPVSVSWATQDGTATAGEDYMATSGLIKFAAGEQSAEITVFIIGDDIGEFQESFFVRLSMPVGANLLDDVGEVIIADDDDEDG